MRGLLASCRETDRYIEELPALLDADPNRFFFFWKGRVALHALLKAAGIGSADEVVLPVFTCAVIPNAIL